MKYLSSTVKQRVHIFWQILHIPHLSMTRSLSNFHPGVVFIFPWETHRLGSETQTMFWRCSQQFMESNYAPNQYLEYLPNSGASTTAVSTPKKCHADSKTVKRGSSLHCCPAWNSTIQLSTLPLTGSRRPSASHMPHYYLPHNMAFPYFCGAAECLKTILH